MRRRIAQVDAGEVGLVPGEQAPDQCALTRRLCSQGGLMISYGFHPDALLEYAEATTYYLREVCC